MTSGTEGYWQLRRHWKNGDIGSNAKEDALSRRHHDKEELPETILPQQCIIPAIQWEFD